MYFEVENTPEHIKKRKILRESEIEEAARLILAPFTAAPKVVFDNVPIGRIANRPLDIHNPTRKSLLVLLSKEPSSELGFGISLREFLIHPGETIQLTLTWRPFATTSVRETLHFQDDNRGKYEIILIFKSVVEKKTVKGAPKQTPKKVISKKIIKRRSPVKNRSPPARTSSKVIRSSFSQPKAPAKNVDFFVDFRLNEEEQCNEDKENNRWDSFSRGLNISDESYASMSQGKTKLTGRPTYLVKKSNSTPTSSVLSAIENLEFTPLKPKAKSNVSKIYEDSLENIKPKGNDTHSIIDLRNADGSVISIRDSPDCNKNPEKSTHISIVIQNMGYSQINESDIVFDPHQCSTERKDTCKHTVNHGSTVVCKDLFNEGIKPKVSERAESPIIPLDDPNNSHNVQSSPKCTSTPKCRCSAKCTNEIQTQTIADENIFQKPEESHNRRKRLAVDRNCDDNIKNVIQANLWQKSPMKSLSSLSLIPEESCLLSETHCVDKRTETFNVNRTYDLPETFNVSTKSQSRIIERPASNQTSMWKKSMGKTDTIVWKVPPTVQINPDRYITNAYSTASTLDPFLSTTYFYDEELVDKFEKEFKRWLNCLLTPPAELDSAADGTNVDVGRVWIENRNKEVPEAPTKEQVSSKYHTSHRLESLRKSARALIMSESVMMVFVKLSAQIDKKILAIRTDKNLHLDIGLQKIIMDLLLCYNPLWLRMGLEAIYGTVIPLTSNNDIYGLSTFIIQRMFRDPYAKSKSQNHLPNMITSQYTEYMRKFTLKKYFMLVYFLDQAKQKKLICHDPCLFCRTATYKESRELLIRFTRELVTGVGNITKHLRPLGYTVSHKQSDLDEYKYAVQNLATDLKDGVRLTRLMEIILVKPNLTMRLRVPAISRLQKIHNVKLALTALSEAGFDICGDIAAKDVSDGHREKTLSLLWQIIHRFRAPLFEKAATMIQQWWRKKYLFVYIRNRIRCREQRRFNEAATKIQSLWRAHQQRRLYIIKRQKTVTACIKIQKFWRMWQESAIYIKRKDCAVKIQRWYRGCIAIKTAKTQLEYKRLRNNCATVIQSYVRCFLQMRRFTKLKNAVTMIQSLYRATLIMRSYRFAYLNKKKAVISIQQHWRALISMRSERQSYLKLKQNVVKMQLRYRSLKQGQKTRREYLELKRTTEMVQIKIRAKYDARKHRREYLSIRNSVITIQRAFRSYLVMKKKKNDACITIQRRFRAMRSMKSERRKFETLKNATVAIQRLFRANRSMNQTRAQYLTLKKACIVIQNQFRANIIGRSIREHYNTQKSACLLIQRRFRSYKQMKKERKEFLRTKAAVLIMQRRYKALLTMRATRDGYLQKRNAVVVIQCRFRANILMKKVRASFLEKRKACIVIQMRFRARLTMIETRSQYKEMRNAIIIVQRQYRAQIAMKQTRCDYLALKRACVTIQTRYRANKIAQECRDNYVTEKYAITKIQRWYRLTKLTHRLRDDYLTMRCAAVQIQNWFRGVRSMVKVRNDYCDAKRLIVFVQRRFRATRMMRFERSEYLKKREAAVKIQQWYRSVVAMRRCRAHYCAVNKSAILIQGWYRSILCMRLQQRSYFVLRKSVVVVQQRFRANCMARKCREKYVSIRNTIILLQNRFRYNKLMQIQRRLFLQQKKSAIKIQAFYRMYREKLNYLQIRNATTVIQRYYRSFTEVKKCRQQYLFTIRCVVRIQSAVRSFLARKRYQQIRSATLTIQTFYRQRKLIEITRTEKQQKIYAIILIQSHLRGYLARKEYEKQIDAILTIQFFWKATLSMRKDRNSYIERRNGIIRLQAAVRGYLCRKHLLELKEKLAQKREEKRKERAAIAIQAIWRGHSLRSNYKDERVISLRKRWKEGALESTQETLAERNEDALEVLTHFSDMASVIRAFLSLDLLTRVYPMMYEKKSIGSIVSEKLIMYMSVTNRSISSLETLRLGISVLVNLARYKPTAYFVYSKKHVNIILTLMMRWSDKDSQFFRFLCTLIWLFGNYESIHKELSVDLAQGDNIKMLQRIRSSIQRKTRMDQHSTRNKNVHRLVEFSGLERGFQPGKFNQSNDSRLTTAVNILPCLKPDYGIPQPNTPRVFMDDLQAIDNVFIKFNLRF